MSEPKRHHYLPQFYLEGFCDKNGKLSVYDREKKEYREQQSPTNTAVQSHYYRFIGKDGSTNTDIEKFFSRIETETKPIIKKINEGQKITESEKEGLSIFISFQKTRVPVFKETHDETMKIFYKTLLAYAPKPILSKAIASVEGKTGQKVNLTCDEITKEIQHFDERYEIKLPSGNHFDVMLKSAIGIGEHLLQMNWEFIYAPLKKSFITSDNPFSLIPPMNHNTFRGVGIITPGAVKLIPLSAKVCLIIFDKGNRMNYLSATPEKVRSINKYITIGCDRLLIGESLSLLKSLVEATKIYNIKETARINVT